MERFCKGLFYTRLLEKWFPLQGERAQSLKVYNIRVSVFNNNIIEMRKRNKVITFSIFNNCCAAMYFP